MADFDFDEIDRAVSSATTPGGRDDNVVPNAQTDPTKPPEAVKSKSTLAGRRSSGQFMDVVHPSSNMRKSTLVMPERPVQPRPAEVTKIPDVIPAVPAVKPAEPVAAPPKAEWPDPIDMAKPQKAPTDSDDDDIDKINQEITNELENKESDSLPETPFIPGTKVEKRPLGAFSVDTDLEEPVMPQQNGHDEMDSASTTDGLSRDELEEEMVKIESDETPGPEDQPAEAAPEKPTPVAPAMTPKPAPEEHKTPIEATSINQQYQEKPSTGEQTSGAIYDTEAYHKALMHPPKKKSGWMWVVWILLIAVFGVVVGVVVYNYVLPSL